MKKADGAVKFKSYRIADFLNRSGTEIDFAASALSEMPHRKDRVFPHRHDFYEILWIEKGKSRQAIDYREFEIRPKSLFFISPHQLHLFEDWEGVDGYCLMFTESFLLQHTADKEVLYEMGFLDNLQANPFLDLRQGGGGRLKPALDLLLHETREEDPSPPVLASLLYVFLKQVQRLYRRQSLGPPPLSKMTVIFGQFKKMMEQEFERNTSPSQYAEKLGVTAQTLNRVVMSVTGKCARQLIIDRRILEAKRLLSNGRSNVSEIAYRLGFEDLSYFARTFRKAVGLAPGEFRRQLSEKYR